MLNQILLIVLILISVFYGDQLKNDFLNTKRSSIVKLTNFEKTSGGTGFYVRTPSGKIVTMTNNHVCRLAKDGIILSDDGLKATPSKVIATYENNDLCIVEAPEYITSGLSVAGSVREGENIYVLGHPLLMPKSLVPGQISGGIEVEIVQGYNVPDCKGKTYREVKADPNDLLAIIMGIKTICIRTTQGVVVTANILPGNSGSPVLDTFGHVVGVAFAGSPGTSRGIIVPLEDLKDFLKNY